MTLTINGENRDDVEAATVKALLDVLKIQTGRVAVEVNFAVVKKSDYENFMLKDGDVVEIVNFVGGG